jgi:hypothetical protein
VDTFEAWAMTVILKDDAPKDECRVDLTPRRLQKFRTPRGAVFAFTVTDLRTQKVLGEGKVTADEFDLVTLRQIPLVKGRSRVQIAAAK